MSFQLSILAFQPSLGEEREKMEMVRSPIIAEQQRLHRNNQDHHHHHHHQSQFTQNTEHIINSNSDSKLRSRKQLCLENYLSFFYSHDFAKFTVDHLNMIVSIHGFKKLDKRKQSEEAVREIEPINPVRSTLEDNISSSFKASITLNEAIKDLRSLNWQECSITSIKTINKQCHDIVTTISAKKLTNTQPLKAAAIKKKKNKKQSCCSSRPSSSNSTSNSHDLALALPIVVNTSAVKGFRKPVLKRRKVSSFPTSSCSGSSL